MNIIFNLLLNLMLARYIIKARSYSLVTKLSNQNRLFKYSSIIRFSSNDVIIQSPKAKKDYKKNATSKSNSVKKEADAKLSETNPDEEFILHDRPPNNNSNKVLELILRPSQIEVIEKLRGGFEDLGHTRILLYAPTGFGKTEVAMAIMKDQAEKKKKVIMIMDRIVLVSQTSDRLSKYDIEHGVIQANHKRNRPNEYIQICSIQTLERLEDFPTMDLLIIDECHTNRARVNEYMKNNPNVKVIGLTATPFATGLGQIYSHVVNAPSTCELVEKGWLAPLKVFIAKEIDMTDAEKSYGEWTKESATIAGIKINGDVVSEWKKMTYKIYGKPMKTIVFCAGAEHGKELEKQFKDAGYNFISISYLDDDEFKRNAIEEFSKSQGHINIESNNNNNNDTIYGLIATDMLTRGFDVPDVYIGISARPFSNSFSSHVQQMGRIMRSCKDKEFGLWIDHSGNYLRFLPDWNDIYNNGISELDINDYEKPRKELSKNEKKVLKCPSCNAFWSSPTNTCLSCGHIRKISKIISIPGELKEINILNQSKQIFYSELIKYAEDKGFKRGWSWYTYYKKFNEYPLNLEYEPSNKIRKETRLWVKNIFEIYITEKNLKNSNE